MAAIDSAYHYYLSTYGSSMTPRYDTHKKSELRAVYNNIVKTNKESPLFKITDTGDAKKTAIDIKERARSIQNVVASFSDDGSGIESVFQKKIAQSSDENVVSAEYIGSNSDVDDAADFDIEVRQLATPQVNMGHYLVSDRSDIRPGSYSFDLTTNLSSYEFQYTVGENDTNRDVQNKLIRLIHSAGIGLNAELVEDDEGRSAVRISSKQTGLGKNEDFLFEILPTADNGSMRAMRTLGIDNVEENARNSSFILNGTERSSYSNTFTVNNAFELTLKGTNEEGDSTTIGFKTNADAIADNVQTLVTAYNNMVQLGHNYYTSQQSGKLLHDMTSVAKNYYNELEAVGLNIEDNGYISIDRSLLTDAVTAPDAADCFSLLNDFKDSLSDKASSVSIDPMNYVKKILIAYKNPGHNFATPYITSIYSGMMLDQYC
jgi:flagellar hook-associated protein 2